MQNVPETGRARRLIFENHCNGVDIAGLQPAFRMSAAEIEKEIAFVARKITEYRFRRCADGSRFAAPPVACATLADIRLNRRALLDTLRRLGDTYLSSPMILPRVQLQAIDHPAALAELGHRMSA